MIKVLVTPLKGDVVEIFGASDLTADFARGTLRVNYSDEGGPRTGEYAMDQVKDIDWEVVQGTNEFERNLTTYQQRAIQNLPPVLPGAPDYTYNPELPRQVKPTEAKMPDMEASGSELPGVRSKGMASGQRAQDEAGYEEAGIRGSV